MKRDRFSVGEYLLFSLALLAVMLLCGGCAAEKTLPKVSETGFYLDTVVMLNAYVEDAQVLKDALEECGRYEQLLSRTIEGSDVWRINHANGAPVEVSASCWVEGEQLAKVKLRASVERATAEIVSSFFMIGKPP